MGSSEPWVGVRKVSTHLGVARDSVYRWVESKALPAHRVGRLLRFRISEVDAWVAVGGGRAPQPRDSLGMPVPTHRRPKLKAWRDR